MNRLDRQKDEQVDPGVNQGLHIAGGKNDTTELSYFGHILMGRALWKRQ